MNYFLTSSLCHLSPTQFPGCNLVIATRLPHGLWRAAGWQSTGQVLREATDTQQRQLCFRQCKQLPASPLASPYFQPCIQAFGSPARAFPTGNRMGELSQLKDTWERDGGMKNRGESAACHPTAGFVFPPSSSHLYKNCRRVGNSR